MSGGEAYTVNSDLTRMAFGRYVDQMYAEHKYLTFPKPRIGADRSTSQNNLFHVWLAEYIAHLLKKNKKQVVPKELAGIKRTVKKLFYSHFRYDWMIQEVTDYSTGLAKKDYTSSGDWLQGEMFLVLNFLQLIAAENGCILESKGEHAKLTRNNT